MVERVVALIVAAGRGERAGFGNDGAPKQYRAILGQPVLVHSIKAFSAVDAVDAVRVVIGADHEDRYRAATRGLARLGAPIIGGATRAESVLRGMEALADDPPEIVLIHDAARPFVPPSVIVDVIETARSYGGALPVLPVTDTVKHMDRDRTTVGRTINRDELGLAQTPQGFQFSALLDAHRRAAKTGETFTDDAAVAEWAGLSVRAVAGDPCNVKLTTPLDFAQITQSQRPSIRVGFGFDVHAFEPGPGLVIGGVPIDHPLRLEGHSDADVLLHAITDALFGVVSDGDIGAHFPPSDPRWKGVTSDVFLIAARDMVAGAGGTIEHVDATVICEAPKIGPHRNAIRARIADLLNLPVTAVAVKATTTERLGFTGREEGIAAQAAATVAFPSN